MIPEIIDYPFRIWNWYAEIHVTRDAMSLRRSCVKTVEVQIAPVEFSIGAIFTRTVFTKFLLRLIASQFNFPLLHPRT